MRFQDLPTWMHALPVALGVGLAIAGMYVFPLMGLRNVLGPIIGLPVGTVVGFGILELIARARDKRESS